ncbi:unnamed protein product [Cyclocybe aegerita]|uniref:O-methyltransferase C-terminal domain-containing protein n=1 Tax=Cyclocybe aegerita TaxID=1973307 RepID=A0A8S0XUE4_CYCAE|nr:unnamed protein product [Cyclocybe aegerita]
MSSPARQLLELLSASLSTIEKVCAEKRFEIPDLNAPFHPASEAFRSDPIAGEAANVLSAAALQLAAIFAPPQVSLYHMVGGFFRSAALRVCLESSVTEILREGGPNGVHINDIGAKNGQDPQKIGRFLRILSNHHVYREVRPNIFANTRISSMLDTLKPSVEIIAHPEKKHENTHGLPALAAHHLDEAFKAAAYSWEIVSDPQSTDAPTDTPLSRATGRKETLWDYYQRPENLYKYKRFNIGMQGVRALQPENASLDAFDWGSLAPGSVVVDVGGGVGTASLPIARKYPELYVILQDLPPVIEDAKRVWSKELPDALTSERVTLESHDFFTSQPHKGADVFILKQILHDWADPSCVKILTQLREAASPNTTLVLMESLMPFACHDPGSDLGGETPGAVPKEAPAPLLANYGAANDMGFNADITMFLLLNAQERTVVEMDDLLRRTGWKMACVHRQEGGDSTFIQSIEAVPVKCM